MFTHDKKTENLFIYWLSIKLSLIFIMIIVGGLTRLTDSGLSITEWELFKGILPPLNKAQWETYFQLYKQIPQFKILNSDMALSEFKVIFYWEYIHRMLGRIIGLFFLLPLVYFHFFKKIDFKHLILSYTAFVLVVIQGLVGWYMVQSGLVNDVTVSHYRLSLHLVIAVLIISIIFWQLLSLLNKKNKYFFTISKRNLPYIFFIILILIQITFGAFVSGLDAGRIYQTWPLMGINYFPDDVTVKKLLDLLDFSNHSLVQFYHRNLAYVIVFYSLIISYFSFKEKDKKIFTSTILMISTILLQILLGIFTLYSNLNIAVSSAHQISSIILILSALNLYYSIIK